MWREFLGEMVAELNSSQAGILLELAEGFGDGRLEQIRG